jgi:hypothetical protein
MSLRALSLSLSLSLSLLCTGLSLMEQDILKDWKSKFDVKYTVVGKVKR